MKRKPCSKQKHKSEGAAWAAVKSLEKKIRNNPSKDRSGYLRAYKCQECGAWHTGHWNSREGLIALIDRAVAADKEKRRQHSVTPQ